MNIIQELRDLADLYGGCLYEDRVLSNDLHRIADRLEALNALVPVPHGKPCERRKCYLEFFVYENQLYNDPTDTKPTKCITGRRVNIPWNAIVQPVRLVPLAQLLEKNTE